ncbi:MAG: hypothetical protein GX087_10840 [Desulfobulbaceae bacterium]|nr:hypothetical protein [Desulfobulbaceae bacterium]
MSGKLKERPFRAYFTDGQAICDQQAMIALQTVWEGSKPGQRLGKYG